MEKLRRKSKILILAIFVLSVHAVAATDNGKVLLIVRDGSIALELMLSKEVLVMKNTMQNAGYEVIVATEKGLPIKGGNYTITPQLKLSDVNAEEYAGVMIPCMAAGIPGTYTKKMVEIVQIMFNSGKPIAAQNGAVAILGMAGILNGKKYAMEYNYIKEGVYSGVGVIEDGAIVTSGTCPYMARQGLTDGTIELTERFMQLVVASQAN